MSGSEGQRRVFEQFPKKRKILGNINHDVEHKIGNQRPSRVVGVQVRIM
jgi:hypothetical protein